MQPIPCLLALCALLALPVQAQPVPERFALLDKDQVAILCRYALLSQASYMHRTGDAGSKETQAAVLAAVTLSGVWDTPGLTADVSRRWQVVFDGQSKEHRVAQIDYCTDVSMKTLSGMTEADASRVRDKAQKIVQGLVKLPRSDRPTY